MHNEEEEQKDATQKKVMEYHEQVDAFTFELENLIERFSSEFDLTRETMVGCLFTSMQFLGTPMVMDLGADMLEEDENEQE
jgi:hypothetical protein